VCLFVYFDVTELSVYVLCVNQHGWLCLFCNMSVVLDVVSCEKSEKKKEKCVVSSMCVCTFVYVFVGGWVLSVAM
jgi:hypothetical protein